MSTETFEARRAAFHAHLDECQRCANEPFNLCATRARLLREAATAPPLGLPRLVPTDSAGRVTYEDVKTDD